MTIIESMEIIPKRFSEKDINERVEWINNPAINKNMYFDLPASIENTERWYKGNIGNAKRIDFSFYDSYGITVAMGGFTSIDSAHNNAEFYVMVNPIMHGRGIGKQVSKWMYNYAFSILNLNKIYLYTNDDNISAYKIYEDTGFQLEGVLRDHKWKNGKYQNRRFYGLLKSEWVQQEWRQELDNEI